MSSIAENRIYPTIRMSKTKKRVTAATKLQAFTPNSMPELQFPRRNPQWLSPFLARRDHNHAPPFI